MKSKIFILIITIILCFPLAGCKDNIAVSKTTYSNNISKVKPNSQDHTGTQNNVTSDTRNLDKTTTGGTSNSITKVISADNAVSMQQLSNSMNKLENTLTAIDDTNEISETQTAINNSLK